jgi:hypothetical protein
MSSIVWEKPPQEIEDQFLKLFKFCAEPKRNVVAISTSELYLIETFFRLYGCFSFMYNETFSILTISEAIEKMFQDNPSDDLINIDNLFLACTTSIPQNMSWVKGKIANIITRRFLAKKHTAVGLISPNRVNAFKVVQQVQSMLAEYIAQAGALFERKCSAAVYIRDLSVRRAK